MRIVGDPGSWQVDTMLQDVARDSNVQEDRRHDNHGYDDSMEWQDDSTVYHARILTSISTSSPRLIDGIPAQDGAQQAVQLPPIQAHASQSENLPSLSELNLRPDVVEQPVKYHEPTSRRPSFASDPGYSSASEGSQCSTLSPTYARSDISDDTFVGSFHSPSPQLSPLHFSMPQYAKQLPLHGTSPYTLPLPSPTFHQEVFPSATLHSRHTQPRPLIMGYPPVVPRNGPTMYPCRSTGRASKRRSSTPDENRDPHNNRKYEQANKDWIYYHRMNLDVQWKALTEKYNKEAELLLQYAELNRTPEIERRESGLQAVYYRARLELPKRDAHGDLVIEDGKVVMVEIKVREEEDNNRKLNLITMFPERVAYYNYFFVRRGEMELAKALAARDIARKREFGIPPWQPETRTQRRPRTSGCGL